MEGNYCSTPSKKFKTVKLKLNFLRKKLACFHAWSTLTKLFLILTHKYKLMRNNRNIDMYKVWLCAPHSEWHCTDVHNNSMKKMVLCESCQVLQDLGLLLESQCPGLLWAKVTERD